MSKKAFMQILFKQSKSGGLGILPTMVFSPFADWDYYYLYIDTTWTPESEYESIFKSIDVPSGFVTDFTSVPRPFWWLMPPTGRYAGPAIFHDYLYWTQNCSRTVADLVFKIGMRELGVPQWKTFIIYQSVKWLGFIAWNSNAKLKRNGEKRFLRKNPPPNDASITWDEWKKGDVFK